MTRNNTIHQHNNIEWRCIHIAQLTPAEMYELLKLRINVFVVEQNCAYADLDGKDLLANVFQLLGYREVNGAKTLIAYARLLASGISYTDVSIGRVIVHPEYRGAQLAHQLIQQAIQQIQTLWGEQPITIGAQAHLKSLYAQHGFEPIGKTYLEDGIPHIDMQRNLR